MEIGFTNYKHADEIKKKPSENILYPIKTLLFHTLFFSIITLLITYLFSSNVHWMFFKINRQFLFLSVFLLMGISHILFFPKWMKYINRLPLKSVLIYSIAFALALGLIVCLYFLLSGQPQTQLAVISAFSFLLPLIIGKSYSCFTDIDPIISIEPWFVPTQKLTTQKRVDLPNSFGIKFTLKMFYFDKTSADFDIIIAGGLRLGKVFHEFLVENNDTDLKIQQLNYQLKPYAWMFFVKRFSGLKKLDPLLTFFDNGVKENDNILIERINM